MRGSISLAAFTHAWTSTRKGARRTAGYVTGQVLHVNGGMYV